MTKKVGKKGYRNLDKRLKVLALAMLCLEVSGILIVSRLENGDEASRDAAARAAKKAEEAVERARLLEAYVCERDGDEVVAERLAQIRTRQLDAFFEQIEIRREEQTCSPS